MAVSIHTGSRVRATATGRRPVEIPSHDQLTLFDPPSVEEPESHEWEIDAETRELGRRSVAAVLEQLHTHMAAS